MKNSFVFSTKKTTLFKRLSLVFVIVLLSGCFRYYYEVKERKSPTDKDLQEMQSADKYFILHNNALFWNIGNVKIENGILSGIVNNIPSERYNFLSSDLKKPYRYYRRKKVDESFILNEIHIYVNEPIAIKDVVGIPLNSINKIEIYNKDKSATTASFGFGTIGVAGVTILTAAILSGAFDSKTPPPPPPSSTQSSCPFVFTTDGETNSFAGEIFGGAIFPTLERDDYLALPSLKSIENNYYLFLTNQAREIQSTNLAELYVIDHPANTEVIIDKYGNVLTTSEIQKPLTVVDSEGRSQLKKATEADGITYFALPLSRDEKSTDELIMTFNVPENCPEGKLILRARNSLIVDYSYQKYAGLFGEKWAVWQDKINDKPQKELNKWNSEQGIPLSVYIEENGTWKFLDYFLPPGPLAFRDNALRINLAAHKKSEVKIKLEAGKLFWEIDRIGMDFAQNSIKNYLIIKPIQATDQDSTDVLSKLLYEDGNYVTQPEIGDEVELVFHEPAEKEGMKRSVFLHSRGYYTILGNNGRGKSLVYLQKFRKPSSFTHFVSDNYFEILNVAQN